MATLVQPGGAGYTDAEAVSAVEASDPLTLAGDVTIDGAKSLAVDVVSEKDADAGVTIDGVLIKDGLVDGVDVSAISAGGPTLVPKTVDETVTSSAALQDDDELTFPVTANTIYRVRGNFVYTVVTAEQIRFSPSLPAGATFTFDILGIGIAANLNFQWGTGNVDPALMGANASGVKAVAVIEGIIEIAGTAGDFTLQWAQNISGIVGSTMHDGSWIEYEMVS